MSKLQILRSTAYFGLDRRYRYSLCRRWKPNGATVAFIGLNPLTADETKDAPTIRRCIDFANRWHYSEMMMVNIFAIRATDPREMLSAKDPVGELNDEAIKVVCNSAQLVVAAWGNHGAHLSRGEEVMKMISEMRCFGLTNQNQPKHPLYLAATSKLSILSRLRGE